MVATDHPCHSRRALGPLWLRGVIGGLFLGVSVTAGGCSPSLVEVDGLGCDGGACLDGYTCHPQTYLCAPTVDVGCSTGQTCPSTTSTGDLCPSAGSFLPCDAAAIGCSGGCRTCLDDGTWSPCSGGGGGASGSGGTGGGGGAAGSGGTGGSGGAAGSGGVGGAGGSAGSGGGCPVCTDYYRDDDRDGVGLAADSQCLCAPAAPYDTTVTDDCDDNADQTFPGAAENESSTACMKDADQDGFGDDNPGGSVVAGTDCDDGDNQCATSCTDGDGDGFCAGIDCYDDDNSCTTDCSTCPPKTLALTIVTAGPINPSDSVTLEIDLDTYLRDAAAELSCTTTAQTLHGPIDFSTCPATDWVDNQADCRVETVGPFNRTECNGAGNYLELRSNPNARVDLDPGIDATAYASPILSFVAAVENGYAGTDLLEVRACCGSGCSLNGGGPLIATIPPADIGDAQACSTQAVVLPFDACSNLRARLAWDNFTPTVGVDDLTLMAPLLVSAPVASGPGLYTATLTAGQVGTVDVTCTWYNTGIGSSVADTQPLIVQ